MALLMSILQEILPLLPDALHGKITDVHQKAPGSLIKFLDPVPITKKIECREQGLRVDPSMLTDQSEDGMYAVHVPPSPTHYHDYRSGGPQVNPYVDPRRISHEKMTPSSPTYGYPSAPEYNKYCTPLRAFVFQSINKAFQAQKIKDVPAKPIVDDIVDHCFQQCPDWGRYKCETPSTIVRFDKFYINQQPTQSLNINVYVYAFLKFEYEESLIPWKGDKQPRISFEISLELNGVALKLKKINEISQLLYESQSISDAIKKIESTSAVTWQDLENTDATRSQPTKAKLTWDDL